MYPFFLEGILVKGVKFAWRSAWSFLVRELAPQDKTGMYVRPKYAFSHPMPSADFPLERGRYVLYVGNACPWCHRVLLALAARGLLDSDLIQVVRCLDDPERASRGGWYFDTPEPFFGARDLREVYDAVSGGGGYVGRCTAPLLVDVRQRRPVCNESADLVRMISALSAEAAGGNDVDLYPPDLRADIDALNDTIYTGVNNAVYRSGFATTQGAYDAAQRDLWGTLRALDERLATRPFLLGDCVTEADLRLLPTVLRFDLVYHDFFRCTRYTIRADFPHVQRWMMQLWGWNAGLFQRTIDLEASRRSYYLNLFPINPSAIVPAGPTVEDLGFTGSGAVHVGGGPAAAAGSSIDIASDLQTVFRRL